MKTLKTLLLIITYHYMGIVEFLYLALDTGSLDLGIKIKIKLLIQFINGVPQYYKYIFYYINTSHCLSHIEIQFCALITLTQLFPFCKLL